MNSRFDRFNVGDRAEFSHEITQGDVDKFVEITGDDNPLHVDREFARKTQFKNVVTHGMLSASFLSTMIGKHIPGEGALWMSQNIEFLLPVRLNDVLLVTAEITKKIERDSVLELSCVIYNQHRQKILTGSSKVKVLEVAEEEEVSEGQEVEKVVLVTGASKGIGAETAVLLGKSGYLVAVNYRSDDQGATEVQRRIENDGGRAILVKADVSSENEVDKMFGLIRRELGPVTHLVNNASSKIVGLDFLNSEWVDFQKHIDVQLKGTFLCTKRAVQDMVEQGFGSIVNIGSSVVDGVPPVKWTSYTMAKAGIASLTKSLAAEFGPKRIRINTVSPGLAETTLTSEIPPKQMKVYAMQTPLRSLAKTSEIAETIAFLLGDNSSYITGENIRVAGGKVMS